MPWGAPDWTSARRKGKFDNMSDARGALGSVGKRAQPERGFNNYGEDMGIDLFRDAAFGAVEEEKRECLGADANKRKLGKLARN